MAQNKANEAPMSMTELCLQYEVDRRTVGRMIAAGELQGDKFAGQTGAYVFNRQKVAEAFAKHPRRPYRGRRTELAETG